MKSIVHNSPSPFVLEGKTKIRVLTNDASIFYWSIAIDTIIDDIA